MLTYVIVGSGYRSEYYGRIAATTDVKKALAIDPEAVMWVLNGNPKQRLFRHG